MLNRRHHRGPVRIALCAIGMLAGTQPSWCQALANGGRLNDFPATATAEAFVEELSTVNVGFKLYFPVDDTRYLAVDEKLCQLLQLAPAIEADPGLRARALSVQCEPRDFTFATARGFFTVRGAWMTTAVEILPSSASLVGTRRVTLAFPLVDRAFNLLKARAPSASVAAWVDVRVWGSRGEKAEAERRAAEEARIQEEARARADRERRLELIRKAGIGAAVLAVVAFGLFLQRRWIWPDFAVTLAPGGYSQGARVLRIRDAGDAEPGAIIETAWARSRTRKRTRIKVEALVGTDGQSGVGGWTLAGDTAFDVLVSVGVSVAPGTYLARLSTGAVRVRVAPGT